VRNVRNQRLSGTQQHLPVSLAQLKALFGMQLQRYVKPVPKNTLYSTLPQRNAKKRLALKDKNGTSRR